MVCDSREAGTGRESAESRKSRQAWAGLVLGLLGCLVLAATPAAVRAQSEKGEKSEVSLTGGEVELDLKTLDGKRITAPALRGRVVMMEFWATWCGPCVKQVPHLKKLVAEYQPQGVAFIGISLDSHKEKAEEFIEKHEMNWLHVYEREQDTRLSKAWGVRGIPHAFIFGPQGQMLWRGHPARIDQPLANAVERFPHRKQQQAEAAAAERTTLHALRVARDELRKYRSDFDRVASALAAVDSALLDGADRVRRLARSVVTALELGVRDEDEERLQAALTQNPDADQALQQMRSTVKVVDPLPAGPMRDGTDAPTVAQRNRERVAGIRLKLARRLHESEQPHEAFEKYQEIVTRYPNTPAAKLAQSRIEDFLADEDFAKAHERWQIEAEARAKLAMARNYLALDKSSSAYKTLREIVDEFPESDAATEAEALMDSMTH